MGKGSSLAALPSNYHRQIPAKKPVVLIDFQALHLGDCLRRELIKRHILDEKSGLLLRELAPVFKPFQHASILGTGGLASHATDQAVVPRRVDPAREITGRLIVVGEATFRADKKTVFGDGPSRTMSQACDA